jgi:hypothetical protein
MISQSPGEEDYRKEDFWQRAMKEEEGLPV